MKYLAAEKDTNQTPLRINASNQLPAFHIPALFEYRTPVSQSEEATQGTPWPGALGAVILLKEAPLQKLTPATRVPVCCEATAPSLAATSMPD